MVSPVGAFVFGTREIVVECDIWQTLDQRVESNVGGGWRNGWIFSTLMIYLFSSISPGEIYNADCNGGLRKRFQIVAWLEIFRRTNNQAWTFPRSESVRLNWGLQQLHRASSEGSSPLVAEIRPVVEDRPTCGYRRLKALLNRRKSVSDQAPALGLYAHPA